MKASFEPKILAFCCNWCAYSGADLAGTSRLQYPPNVKIVRVMCSGRIDPGHIFRAFETGVDGILVAGCHPGDCHYISGNERAEERVETAKAVAEIIGIGEDRIRLEWISASEGVRFAEVIEDFIKEIKAKGPNPVGGDA
ncbi:MAG: hydrogenase iron-sulfur subunit [Candidatus Thermoplasmatota archaeon]|nr:hydrogenase iron-sulfur subunit [Candidatus Thermoplasmatota archaeon]